MPIPFERIIEHREFPNTFLRRVIVYASFETKRTEFFNDHVMNEFKAYLSSMYKHESVGEFPQKALEITNEDGNIDIMFYNGGFLLSINQQGYKSFIDTVVPQLTRMRPFMEKVMNVPMCDEMRIRKVNIWQFGGKKEVDYNFDLTSKAVFSKDLLSYPDKESLIEKGANSPLLYKMVWKEGTRTVNLLTGLAKLDNNISNLILDSELIESSKTPVSEMIESMLNMNGTLYDVYQWSINDNVRNLMDKKIGK